ncbi:MAG: beta-galactosidase [Prevotella sp.]|nr:beta-galactosidase [Prevotella sp.]
MNYKLLIITVLWCLCPTLLSAQGEMPIIAYMGVPNDKTTAQNFKNLSDCGFNVSLYGYASLKEMQTACNVARQYGIRILGHCPETHNSPEVAAAVLKGHPGFFGYVLKDEPSVEELQESQKEITRLKRVDNSHCFYINLHPYYADWTLQHTKTKTYDDYLEAALATSCKQLSFDFYPITRDGLRNGWFSNLEAFRQKSIQSGTPFWGFVLSVPHAVYPQPTKGSLRLQVYSNLAYGAQAIQYYTYWTPPKETVNDYHDGPVDANGKKTKTYKLVKKMNQELRTVSPLFYGAKIVAVNHADAVGSRGIIVSQLHSNGQDYLVIVNKDYQRKIKVKTAAIQSLTTDYKALSSMKSDLLCQVTKELQEKELKGSYTIPSGDILLFKLK